MNHEKALAVLSDIMWRLNLIKEEIARAIASPSVSDYVSLIRLAIVGTFSIPAKGPS